MEGDFMFIVFISSKTKLVSLFLLIIICGVFLFKDSLIKHYYGVKPGVIFLEQDIGGFSRKKVTEIVAAKLGEWQLNPVNALYDPRVNYIIPELWGYEVNLQETVNKIMSASKDEHVFPVYETVFPDITIDDYPSAIITQGNPRKKQITFMINVAWGTEYVLPMLEILNAEGAHATFFVVGTWAGQNEDLMKEISSRGHLLGNHGHTDNVVYTKISIEEMERGLEDVNNIVQTATGQNPLYFTPHKGEYNDLVLEVVSRQGMRTILWSIDTVDWKKPGVEKMKSKVLDNLHEGAIVLMHPTADIVILLKEIVPVIKNKGYSIVTMAELLNPHYPPDKQE
jgi:probable sporulation protein (polysaccharide deacetylase family)